MTTFPTDITPPQPPDGGRGSTPSTGTVDALWETLAHAGDPAQRSALLTRIAEGLQKITATPSQLVEARSSLLTAVAATECRPGTGWNLSVVVRDRVPGAWELWTRLANTRNRHDRADVLTALWHDIRSHAGDSVDNRDYAAAASVLPTLAAHERALATTPAHRGPAAEVSAEKIPHRESAAASHVVLNDPAVR